MLRFSSVSGSSITSTLKLNSILRGKCKCLKGRGAAYASRHVNNERDTLSPTRYRRGQSDTKVTGDSER